MTRRYTESEKWKDTWFRKLSPSEKLFLLYLYDECDVAGFWEIDTELASFQTGLSSIEIIEAMKGLSRACEINGENLWVKRFVRYQQPTYPLNPANNAHKTIIQKLEAKSGFSENVDRVLIGKGLVSPYEGASEPLFNEGGMKPLARGPVTSSNVTSTNNKNKRENKTELPNDDLEKVLKRLNELREQNWEWESYRPLTSKHKKNTEHITALLKDGATVDELIVVLEWKAAMDKGEESSRRFFDCVTPFRPKHWENNIAMASDWDAKGRPAKPSGNGKKNERDATLGSYARGADYYLKGDDS
jgi:hypothetical protein